MRVAVSGGALGCVLLLLRKSVAIYVFVLALVGTVAAQIPDLAIDGLPLEARIGWLTQLVMAVFLVWYARRGRGWIS